MENFFFISEFLSITKILWRGPREAASRGPLQRMSLMLKNSLIKNIFSTPSLCTGRASVCAVPCVLNMHSIDIHAGRARTRGRGAQSVKIVVLTFCSCRLAADRAGGRRPSRHAQPARDGQPHVTSSAQRLAVWPAPTNGEPLQGPLGATHTG